MAKKKFKLKHYISLLKMESLTLKSSVEKERITLKIIKKHVEESMIVKPFMSEISSILKLR